jgi:hypothetical protein
MPSLPGFTSLIKGFRRGEMTVLTGPTGSGGLRCGERHYNTAYINVQLILCCHQCFLQ